MEYSARRNCAAGTSCQPAGTVQAGLPAPAGPADIIGAFMVRTANGRVSRAAMPPIAAAAVNVSDLRKAVNCGFCCSTESGVAGHFEKPRRAAALLNDAQNAFGVVADLPAMSYSVAGWSPTWTVSPIFCNSSAVAADKPTCPRQRLTLAVSPPAMPGSGTTSRRPPRRSGPGP